MQKRSYQFWIAFAHILLLLLCQNSWAWTGKVIELEDGDSGKALKGWSTVEFRLYGIDAPEFDQAYGKQARAFASKMLLWKEVEFKTLDRDQYGREVGVAYVNGQCVNEEMIKSGFAWVYQNYCKESFCGKWMILQKQAQGKREGLWQDDNPTPPWRYRLQMGSRQSPSVVESKTTVTHNHEYHGNVSSKVFHNSKCKNYHCKNCTARFSTREQAIKAGYKPCGICKP